MEIKHHVLSYLTLGELLQCTLVSKAWLAATESVLYSAVDLTWTDPEDTRFVALVRTVLNRTELGLHIHSLRLRGSNFSVDDSLAKSLWPRKLKIAESEADSLVACIKQLCIPFQVALQHGIRQGTVDALLAFLLSQSPNLVSLFVGPNFDGGCQLIGNMLKWSLHESQHHRHFSLFGHLQEVSIGLDEEEPVLWNHSCENIRKSNTLDLLPVFYLPHIRRVSASLDGNQLGFQWPRAVTPTAVRMTFLKLDCIREQELEYILAATSRLETLHWTCRPGAADSDYILWVDLDQIAAAITPVRETLITLTLPSTVSICGKLIEEQNVRVRGSLQTLYSLDKVVTFSVSLLLLMGGLGPEERPSAQIWHGIPPNVEHVIITDEQSVRDYWAWKHHRAGMPYFHALQAWLGVWRQYHPRLQRVELLLEHVDDGSIIRDYGYLDELHSKFSQEGVVFYATGIRRELG